MLYGFGINDSENPVARKGRIICPYYRTWANMLHRAYDKYFWVKNPTYSEVTVCESWRYLSEFKKWMSEQYWEGMTLDKDILLKGNKKYCEERCCFVPHKINCLVNYRPNDRGDFPLGVVLDKTIKGDKKYRGQIYILGKSVKLGRFKTPIEAHQEWQKAKIKAIEEGVKEWKESGCPSYKKEVGDALLLRAEDIRNDLRNGKETVDL